MTCQIDKIDFQLLKLCFHVLRRKIIACQEIVFFRNLGKIKQNIINSPTILTSNSMKEVQTILNLHQAIAIKIKVLNDSFQTFANVF
ncbi:Uncharacterised protein [Streptococcus pneumoniae]|nr:Uncharacterised protein [Streptococcus pneumoniae]